MIMTTIIIITIIAVATLPKKKEVCKSLVFRSTRAGDSTKI